MKRLLSLCCQAVCSVLVHRGAMTVLVGEKALNVRGAYFPLWFGLFVHLADVQDQIFSIFPSSIIIYWHLFHMISCILPFLFFNGVLNKLLIWMISVHYIGCTVLGALVCFVYLFFLIKLFIKINKEITNKVVWLTVFACQMFSNEFFF